MTDAPIPGLIVSLCIPSIITSMITSIYNMIDTFFVAQLGTTAVCTSTRILSIPTTFFVAQLGTTVVAAVGVVFSVSSILSVLGFWMGTRSSSIVLGRQLCVYVTLLIALSHFFGLNGLMAALPAADAFCCLVAVTMVRGFFRRLGSGSAVPEDSLAG